ncbi:MAG: hypothetical protein JW795_05925 [Chitinivibrionales bacterium]|nr:hypothetical protein [Chitinivibrionales bacterium]
MKKKSTLRLSSTAALWFALILTQCIVKVNAIESHLSTLLTDRYWNHLLCGTFSSQFKQAQRTRSNGPYSYVLQHSSTNPVNDTIKIIACRVEFKPDSSTYTTGNGLFGIYRDRIGTSDDAKEWGFYYDNKTYRYDRLYHDSLYFAYQLEYAKQYFRTVSDNRLVVEYELFPSGKLEKDAFTVPEKMTRYSPAAKKPSESYDEFNRRWFKGLLHFFSDAVKSIDADSRSPFRKIYRDQDGFLYETDENNPARKRKVVFLIFHAGSSRLVDAAGNSQSDLFDLFVNREVLRGNADTALGIVKDSANRTGIRVNKNLPNKFTLDEMMWVAETSNQDSINWGIHGILVNQIARQIGIPDLFGVGAPGIGSFCISDYAGYSNGQGFFPPWPSAWVRGYMGWDAPIIVDPAGPLTSTSVKAISSKRSSTDTTMLLVPLNSHEYYLIENRQRNLSSDTALFNYDTLSDAGSKLNGMTYIREYPFGVALGKNTIDTSASSGCITKARNFDAGIAGSGVLVWHIDEHIIRDHIEFNQLNVDSAYRAVALEEADGVVDLGVQFQSVIFNSIYEYGTAEDIFPHYTSLNPTPVNFMGSSTRPSTMSNDGGHTYLTMTIHPSNPNCTKERYARDDRFKKQKKFIYNYADSLFSLQVGRDTTAFTPLSQWPKRVLPALFFEPVLCDVYANGDSLECAVLDTNGRLYLWPANGRSNSFGTRKAPIPTVLYSKKIVYRDSVTFLDSIRQPAASPTQVAAALVIASRDGSLYALKSVDSAQAVWDTTVIGSPLSSSACNYIANLWAVGCSDGSIAFGSTNLKTVTVLPTSITTAINCLAVIDSATAVLAAVNSQGDIFIVSPQAVLARGSVKVPAGNSVYPPLRLAVADLEQDDTMDIVISDNKHGVWLFNYHKQSRTLAADPAWGNGPNDWPGYHRIDTARQRIPDNAAPPSITDLDNDNILDIIIGGTNGIYAFNHRGVQLGDWPALLDQRFWYQRESVLSTPVTALNPSKKEPLVIFSAPTGEKITFSLCKIIAADKKKKIIHFIKNNGLIDSITDLSESQIDTLLTLSDSAVSIYSAPGGYVDAFTTKGRRPDTTIAIEKSSFDLQSHWPLSVGGRITTSVLLCDMDNNQKTDMIAVSEAGWVYRWQLSSAVLSTTLLWPQAYGDNRRTCAYHGPYNPVTTAAGPDVEYFYNYPNPLDNKKRIQQGIPLVFKYKLTNSSNTPATKVRLDIFTFTGLHIVSLSNCPTGLGWNEYSLPKSVKLGSAVYRCRLESDFNGTKKVKFWKMAVINTK